VQLVSQAVCEYFPASTRITRPTGGFVLWVELPPAVNSLDLFDRALADGISIAPGPLFSAKGKFTNFVRLNCGNPWTETIDAALRKLGHLVRQLGG
jgi:DNA-binding transcriptional MocR family regulator